MKNELKLFTDGVVTVKDREFTRLIGGFGEDKPIMTIKQIAELMDYEVKVVNQTIKRNIDDFIKEEGYIQDLKEVTESDHNLEVLKSLGYTNMAIAKAKNIYILSEAGFLLYLKFAECDKAIELYKGFIEDYFKTKAENKVMEKTLVEEKEFLIERKKFILGSMFMEQDENKRIEFFKENEKITQRITKIEVTLSKENIIEQLQPQLSIADRFTNSDNVYDFNTFSKVLSIKGLGRNNLFDWMRKQKILMSNNQPYQRYIEYFKVLAIENKYNGKINYKTMIKANGVKYIFDRLIKDGKIIPKSVEEIMSELSELENLNKGA